MAKSKAILPDMFASDKPDLPKIELSKLVEVGKQEEKTIPIVVPARNDNSAKGMHRFNSEEERKAAFPNPPMSLKQLKERNKAKKYEKNR